MRSSWAGEAVLLLFEQVERERSGVVGLEAGTVLVLDTVTLDGELVAFGLAGGVHGGELLIQYSEHRVAHVGGCLDRLVVVDDKLLHLLEQDRGLLLRPAHQPSRCGGSEGAAGR